MLKTYNFWVRLVAVFVLLVRIVGAKFGFNVDSELILDITTAVASVLVVLGVFEMPPTTATNFEKKPKKEVSILEISNVVREDLTEIYERLSKLTDENNTLHLEGAVNCIKEALKIENNEEKSVEEHLIEEENSVETQPEVINIDETKDETTIKEESVDKIDTFGEEFNTDEGEIRNEIEEIEDDTENGTHTQENLEVEAEDENLKKVKERIRELVRENIDDIIDSIV